MPAAHRLVALMAAYALAGCGTGGTSSEDPSAASSDSAPASASATVAGCPAVARAVREALARPRLRADLDEDGTPDTVGVVDAPRLPCDGAVVVRTSDRVTGVMATGGLPVREVRTLDLPASGPALLTQADHPRRGRQADLMVAVDGVLERVTAGGDPLLPFVAADTGTGLMTARCTAGGVAVLVAEPHSPPGVVFAYDVVERRYRLDGAEAVLTGQREVADNVLPGQVARRFPALAVGRLLAEC